MHANHSNCSVFSASVASSGRSVVVGVGADLLRPLLRQLLQTLLGASVLSVLRVVLLVELAGAGVGNDSGDLVRVQLSSEGLRSEPGLDVARVFRLAACGRCRSLNLKEALDSLVKAGLERQLVLGDQNRDFGESGDLFSEDF